ncbi:hypothetical protein [Streptomyces fungicidicus]|uniref:hypothetical protein n=1 Tax=Streptomyces fungicidicus TaxID=68203 RepID=UPI003819F295
MSLAFPLTTLVVIAALGSTLGAVAYLLATVTGLAALLHTSAVAYADVKHLGAAHLRMSTGVPSGTEKSSRAENARPDHRHASQFDAFTPSSDQREVWLGWLVFTLGT